jgi:glycosyltransferase involved in cell wall biosynthesis
MKNRRVIHVGGGGGVTSIMVALASADAKDSGGVIFFGQAGSDQLTIPEYLHKGVITWRGNFNPLSYIQASWGLYARLKKIQPEFVVLHGFMSYIFGALPARLVTPKVIAVDHGPQVTYVFLKRIFFSLIVRSVAHFVSVSQSSKEWLMQRYGFILEERVTVIENAVDKSQFWKMRGRGFLCEPYIFTMVARLDAPQKDPMTLLRAASILRDRGYQFRVRFVGDGNLRFQMERYIATADLGSFIEIMGFHSDIPQLLSETDVFVLTTKWEGMPVSLIEAMAVSLPIIASEVIGVVDIISDGENGQLVPPEDASVLADVMQKCINDPASVVQLGIRARQGALYRFDQKKMIAAYAALYEKVSREK